MDKLSRASSLVTAESNAVVSYRMRSSNLEEEARAIAGLSAQTGLGVVVECGTSTVDIDLLNERLTHRYNLTVRLAPLTTVTSCAAGEVLLALPESASHNSADPMVAGFMDAPIALIISDQNGIIRAANKQMEVLSGFPINELRWQFVGIFFSTELLPHIRERHERLIAEGRDEPALFSLLRKDGEARIVSMSTRVCNTKGAETLKITTLRDQSLEYAADMANLLLLRQELGMEFSIPNPNAVFVDNPIDEQVDSLLAVRAQAVWDLDLKRNRLLRSEGFQIQFGIPSGLTAYRHSEHNPHIHPDDRQRVFEAFNALLADPNTNYWQIEYRHGRIDGKYQTVLDAAYVFRDGEGTAYRLIGVSHNVTRRRKLEMLQSQASQLARNGSWEVIFPENKMYWSPEVFEIHEVEGTEVPPVDEGIGFYKEGWVRDRIRFHYERAIEHGEGWDLELPIITAKGNERWVRTIGRPRMKNGVCVSISGSFQDIDELKRIQLNLSEANERFSLIADVTNEAIYDWDIASNVLFWGKGFSTVFGYDPLVSAPTIELWTELVHPDDRERVAASLDAAIENPKATQWKEEYRYRTSDGRYLYCIDQGGFIRDEEGNAIRMVGSVQDITASKALEDALVTLNRQLASQAQQLATSNKDLEEFAYIASHDMQEPLRMISGFLTQIDKHYADRLDERGRQYIGYAVDGAHRMKRIIQDLLDYARVSRFDDPETRIDLEELVQEVFELHRTTIDECGATITLGELPVIYSFRTPWLQILNNLIGNALKYRKPDAALHIGIDSVVNGGLFALTIRDTGIGIDPQHFDRIFGVFQRLHRHTDYPGTGIGLSLVKKLTETFGGTIEVASAPGEGSTFTLSFPEKLLRPNAPTA